MDLLNALVALANYVIIPGLAYGSQLALGALGITLIYGVLRFSNFAHGDTMAFGATLSILGTWWLQSMGISFGVLPTALLALPFSILGCIALILFTDRALFCFCVLGIAALAPYNIVWREAILAHGHMMTACVSLTGP